MTKKKDEKIKKLEERISKLENEKKESEERIEKEEKPSITGSVLGNIIPGLGGLVKSLAKASPEFAKKLDETDKEIMFRMRKGGSGKPKIEYGFSARPLISGAIKEEKKGKPETIVVWEETPLIEETDLNVYAAGKKLIIETKDKKFRKEIPLSYYVKNIEWGYKKDKEKGMLMVRMKTR